MAPRGGFLVQVLGPMQLAWDGAPLDIAGWQPRALALFRIVATAPGRRRSRDELIDLLWPDSMPEAGASNLRYTLHLLRRAFGHLDPGPLLLQSGWVGLNSAYTWEIDIERFEELDV
ncbi:MAG: AfsR/SARP family transcriptional regulator [Chloroflexota bacterium]